MPLNINATGTSASVSTVNIVSIPSGEYLDKETMARLQQPLTIDVVSQIEQCDPSEQCEREAPAALDVINEAPAESAPESAPEPVQEPNPVLQRAMSLGYTPLPRRPPKVW